ncbi:hypothetical protein KEM56_005196 [Ascosphaera pollenicola]|nr:hypothetical protein KEM56_005196 [Ascosphaera pollenicola]
MNTDNYSSAGVSQGNSSRTLEQASSEDSSDSHRSTAEPIFVSINMDKISLYDRGVISRRELQKYLRNRDSDEDLFASSRYSEDPTPKQSPKGVVNNRGNNNTNFSNCTFNGLDPNALKQSQQQQRDGGFETTGPIAREHNVRSDATGRPIRQERFYYPPSGYNSNTLAALEPALQHMRPVRPKAIVAPDEWSDSTFAPEEQYHPPRRRQDIEAEIRARVIS